MTLFLVRTNESALLDPNVGTISAMFLSLVRNNKSALLGTNYCIVIIIIIIR